MSQTPTQSNPAESPGPDQSPASRDRPLLITFWLMLAAALWCWSLFWNAPILDRHEFRQLQTAVSTHWMQKDGFRLNYETPLFGPPKWSIPMEFPIYQWCVVGVSSATGMALDQSGRATSILFLLATLPAVCGLAGLAGLTRPGRLLVAAAVLSSPVYLFYGRAFMIESTALCFATWFLLAIGRSVRDLSLRWSAIAIVCGTLAALAKITTFAVYCFPAAGIALWLGWPRWKSRRQSPAALWHTVLLCGVPVLISILAGKWWVNHADAVKDGNPYSGFLKSSEMVAWNWGTLDQRLSPGTWYEAWDNISQFVLSEAAAVIMVLCVALGGIGRLRRLAGAGVMGFLMGPLLFTNLYYRHDYYYSANALLLLGAAGLLLASMWNTAAIPRIARILMLALFFGTQLTAYLRGYGAVLRQGIYQPPEIASVIRRTVPPEGVVLIYGWDWNAIISYYSQRRVIMVPGGRETEMKVLEDVVGQLGSRSIAAILIKQRTPTPYPREFIDERLKRFGMATTPFATSADGDLYLPETRIAAASKELDGKAFSHTTINAESAGAANPDDLKDDDLRGLDLSLATPQPAAARSKFGFKVGVNDGHPMILAHPVSELNFSPPAGAMEIDATFGIVDAAYAPNGTGVTDGVGFEIYEVRADGLRRQIFRRELDPAGIPADRGLQSIRLKNAGPFTGKVVFKTTPGPKNNLVNDWAYWSSIHIR